MVRLKGCWLRLIKVAGERIKKFQARIRIKYIITGRIRIKFIITGRIRIKLPLVKMRWHPIRKDNKNFKR